MTYAKARLWLGICGVGSLVVVSFSSLLLQIPSTFLADTATFRLSDVSEFVVVILLFSAWLAPLDFLGGFELPSRYRKSFVSLRFWLRNYLFAVIGQSALFVFFAICILAAGRAMGLPGALAVVCIGMLLCFALRTISMNRRELKSQWVKNKIDDLLSHVQSWQICAPQVIAVRHRDVGFTGGIVGFGKSARIVIPQAWLQTLSRDELATAIARRAVAVQSGSYSRGLAIAFGWNLIGFGLCTQLPGAGVTSVAALVTAFCGFTLWSFFGLLVLPTLSRNASLHIDGILGRKGTPKILIWDTAFSLDQMQDSEPHRSKWIETIFHPIPNVSSRNRRQPNSKLVAWNVARTTLFFSWACFGMLSRAVHCNVGRPELWTMLPTD